MTLANPTLQQMREELRVSEEFLREHEPLLIFLGAKLLDASLAVSGAVDSDAREALDSLIRTYRTLQSGVYYETRPQNPLAGAVCAGVRNRIAELQQRENEAGGVSRTRDSQILGLLVFLQRLELDRNNGRKLGRAFIDFLRSFFDTDQVQEQAPSLILP